VAGAIAVFAVELSADRSEEPLAGEHGDSGDEGGVGSGDVLRQELVGGDVGRVQRVLASLVVSYADEPASLRGYTPFAAVGSLSVIELRLDVEDPPLATAKHVLQVLADERDLAAESPAGRGWE
jgi:hypothetical protein